MNTQRYLLPISLAVALVAASEPAVAQFYKGKNLTLLVNYGAGGNADSAARMFQRHIARHIPAVRTSSCRTCRAPAATRR